MGICLFKALIPLLCNESNGTGVSHKVVRIWPDVTQALGHFLEHVTDGITRVDIHHNDQQHRHQQVQLSLSFGQSTFGSQHRRNGGPRHDTFGGGQTQFLAELAFCFNLA